MKSGTLLWVCLFMLIANLAGAGMTLTVRLLSDGLDVLQIAFIRNLLAFLLLLAFIPSVRGTVLRTKRPLLIFLSAALHFSGMLAFFYGVTLMPLAELQAIFFSKPLFTTLGAVIILHEMVRARRIAALLIGFGGVLLIVQPGSEAFRPAAMLAIISAALFAGVSIVMKRLSETENATTIVLYQNLFLAILSFFPALYVWRMPAPLELPLLLLLGVFGIGAWLFYVRALKLADASIVTILEFAKLPMIALFAFSLFHEVPTIWTWVGSIVICAATAYVTHRESAAERVQSRSISHAAR